MDLKTLMGEGDILQRSAGNPDGLPLTSLEELIRDAIGTILTDSATIQFTYDDAANSGQGSLTAVANIGYADVTGLEERIRDTIGTALTEATGIDITVNDAGDTITIAVVGGEVSSNKLIQSGYLGLDTSAAGPNAFLAADRRFSLPHRALNTFIGASNGSLVKELIIGDSTGHAGASNMGVTDWISVYEVGMARQVNVQNRTAGMRPVQLWTAAFGVEAFAWDTVPANQNVTRGLNSANKQILAGQSAVHTEEATAVTIYYTALRTGGAVAEVTINGTVVGTIDNRDAGIAVGVDFDCGRSVTYTNPSGWGNATVTVAHNGTGTTFELEGAYFHSQNSTTGHMVIRADKSGQSINNLVNAAQLTEGAYHRQYIRNILPQVITIHLGINDGQIGRTAAQMAADFVTMVTNIRAQYTAAGNTWMPAIRYIFPWSWTFGTCPATWLTDYRAAMRTACNNNDVLFIDGHEATGTTANTASTTLDNTDDNLHPNDRGHAVWGWMLTEMTAPRANRRRRALDLAASNSQAITGFGSITSFHGAAGSTFHMGRDGGAAAVLGNRLGAILFTGSTTAYRTMAYGSGIQGVADGNWSPSSTPSRLEFMTSPSGSVAALTTRGGITEAGMFYVGLTQAAATAAITPTGEISAKNLVIGNAIPTTPVNELDVYKAAGATTISTYRANGSLAVPTPLLVNQVYGRINFKGWNDSIYYGASRIDVSAAEAWSAAASGTWMGFFVTPSGTVTVKELLRLYGSPNWATIAGGLQIAGDGGANQIVAPAKGGLDLQGMLQIRPSVLTLSATNGLNSNLALPDGTIALIPASGSTGAFSVGGLAITGTRAYSTGFMVWIVVQDPADLMTIVHEDASSTAAQRIQCPDGVSVANLKRALLVYDNTAARWVLIQYVLGKTIQNVVSSGGNVTVDYLLGNVIQTATTVTSNTTYNHTSAVGPVGTVLEFYMTNDATSGRTVTFGTNFKATGGTLVGTISKSFRIKFVSDGTNWVEESRATNL